jgi:hypothetical protein
VDAVQRLRDVVEKQNNMIQQSQLSKSVFELAPPYTRLKLSSDFYQMNEPDRLKRLNRIHVVQFVSPVIPTLDAVEEDFFVSLYFSMKIAVLFLMDDKNYD